MEATDGTKTREGLQYDRIHTLMEAQDFDISAILGLGIWIAWEISRAKAKESNIPINVK